MIRDVCVWKESVLSSIHTTHCTFIYSLKDISAGRYYQLSILGILLCKKDAEFRMIKFPVKLIVSVHWCPLEQYRLLLNCEISCLP